MKFKKFLALGVLGCSLMSGISFAQNVPGVNTMDLHSVSYILSNEVSNKNSLDKIYDVLKSMSLIESEKPLTLMSLDKNKNIELQNLKTIALEEHKKIDYFFYGTKEIMTVDEASLVNDNSNKDFNFINTVHKENVANIMSFIWYLKINNYSIESIKDIKKLTNTIDIENNKNKKFSNNLTTVVDNLLENIDDIKEMSPRRIKEYSLMTISFETMVLAQEVITKNQIKNRDIEVSSVLTNINNFRLEHKTKLNNKKLK